MTNNLMRRLEAKGFPPTMWRSSATGNRGEEGVHRPLEVIIRNISAGSFAKRYGVEEGIVFDAPTIEFSYKNDDLGDPLLNEYHALALKLATREEIDLIKKYSFAINDLLKSFMKEIGIDLVTSSWSSARRPTAQSSWPTRSPPPTPAGCGMKRPTRSWTRDRFRRDLGGAEEAYEEVMRRLTGVE